MAINVVNVATINGKTDHLAVTTSEQTLLNNAASSGNILKINSLMVANIDGESSASVTVKTYTEDDRGGTGYALVSTASVPADATLIVIDKSTSIYLEEDMSIGIVAGSASDLEATISYEIISDS